LVGAVLVAGGVTINLERTSAWGAGILTALFAIGLALLDLTRLATHLSQFDYWESSAEQLALATGGMIAFASRAGITQPMAARLEWICRSVFAVCLFVFGAAHFVFADFSATFVPKWIPPSQMFWVYLTGAAHIAAGLAILFGLLPLLATRLLVLMYILFGILVHAPRIWSAAANHGNWVEFVVNLALVGVAWIVADSLAALPALAPKNDPG